MTASTGGTSIGWQRQPARMPTIKLKQGSRRLANQASQKAAQQQASTEPVPQAPPTIAELEAKRDAQKALLAKVEKQARLRCILCPSCGSMASPHALDAVEFQRPTCGMAIGVQFAAR